MFGYFIDFELDWSIEEKLTSDSNGVLGLSPRNAQRCFRTVAAPQKA
jgi:hypothetical protein